MSFIHVIQRKPLLPPQPLGFHMKPLNYLSPLGRFETPLGHNVDVDDFISPFTQPSERNISSDGNSHGDIAVSLKSSESISDIPSQENQSLSQNFTNISSDSISLTNITGSKEDIVSKNTNLQKSDSVKNQVVTNNQSTYNTESIAENLKSTFIIQAKDEVTVAPDVDDETIKQQQSANTNPTEDKHLPKPFESLKPLAQGSDFYVSRFVADYLSNKPGIYTSALLQSHNQNLDNQNLDNQNLDNIPYQTSTDSAITNETENGQITEESQDDEIKSIAPQNKLQTQLETVTSNPENNSSSESVSQPELFSKNNPVESQLIPTSDKKNSVTSEINCESHNSAIKHHDITEINPSEIQRQPELPTNETFSNSSQYDSSQGEISVNLEGINQTSIDDKSSVNQSQNTQPPILPYTKPPILPLNHQEDTQNSNSGLIESQLETTSEVPQAQFNLKSNSELNSISNSKFNPKSNPESKSSSNLKLNPKLNPKLNSQLNLKSNQSTKNIENIENPITESEDLSQLSLQESFTQKSSSPKSLEKNYNPQSAQIQEKTAEILSSTTAENHPQNPILLSPETIADENITLQPQIFPQNDVEDNLEKSNQPTSITQTSITQTSLEQAEEISIPNISSHTPKTIQANTDSLPEKPNYSYLPPLSKLSPLVKESDLQLSQFVTDFSILPATHFENNLYDFTTNNSENLENISSLQKSSEISSEHQFNNNSTVSTSNFEQSINTTNQVDLSLNHENNNHDSNLIQTTKQPSDTKYQNNNLKPNNYDIPDSWSDISELIGDTSPENLPPSSKISKTSELEASGFKPNEFKTNGLETNGLETNGLKTSDEYNDEEKNTNSSSSNKINLHRKSFDNQNLNQYVNHRNENSEVEAINQNSNHNVSNSWSNIVELLEEDFAQPLTTIQKTSDEMTSSDFNLNEEEFISSDNPIPKSEKSPEQQSNDINDEDLEIIAYQIYIMIRQKLEIDRECQGRTLLGYSEWLNMIPLNLSIASYQQINQVDFLDEKMTMLAREIYQLISIRLQTEQERYSRNYAVIYQ